MLDQVVADLVAAADPVRIIMFGSTARGTAGPDSDIDLLVVLDEVPASGSVDATIELRRAISVRGPFQVHVTDVAEVARRGHLRGWVMYPALHGEGVVLHERRS